MNGRDDTPPSAPSAFASQAAVDRMHTEDKAWKSGHAEEHREIERRLIVIEHDSAEVDKRLNAGAATFTRIEEALKPSLGKVLVVGAAIFGTAAGLVWQLSRYPDRDEFDKARAADESRQVQVERAIRDVEGAQKDQQADVREIRGAVDRLEKFQDALGRKLDKALERR